MMGKWKFFSFIFLLLGVLYSDPCLAKNHPRKKNKKQKPVPAIAIAEIKTCEPKPPPAVEKEKIPLRIQLFDRINLIIDPSKGVWGLFDDTWIKLSLPLKTVGEVSSYNTNTSLILPELPTWLGIGGMAQYVDAQESKIYLGSIGPSLVLHDIELPTGGKLEGMFMIAPTLIVRDHFKPAAGITTVLELQENPGENGWYVESNTKATKALEDSGLYIESLIGAGYQFSVCEIGTRVGLQVKGIYASDSRISNISGEPKRSTIFSVVGQASLGDLLKAVHITD